MLIRMYLKSMDSCIHFVASSVVEAAAIKSASLMIVVEFSVFSSNCGNALSISPMYAWNLYFHSSKVPYSPVNVGGVILYLCMLIKKNLVLLYLLLVLLHLLLLVMPLLFPTLLK